MFLELTVCSVSIWFLPDCFRNFATPLIAKLFDSVAPDVKTMSRGSAWNHKKTSKVFQGFVFTLIRSAIYFLAASTPSSAFHP